MNLPNKLTIFRIILVPIIVIMAYVDIKGNFLNIPITYWIINIIFIIASYTDHLDGEIARKRNQVTSFGKFADPLADKILVLATMMILVQLKDINGINKLPAWIPIIVIFREFLVSGYRLIAVEKGGKVIAASIFGKIKTATQMLAIIFALIDIYSFGAFINTEIIGYKLIINIIATMLMFISVIAAVFSGYDYLKNGKELLKD